MSPDMIKLKLESAGRTLMMYPRGFPGPNGFSTSWPEILRERLDYLDWDEKEGLKVIKHEPMPMRPMPSISEVNELEMVLDWMVKLGNYTRERRIPWITTAVWLGMLHHPVSGKRVLSWRKIAELMKGASHTAVRTWYNTGIDRIAKQLIEAERVKNAIRSGPINPLDWSQKDNRRPFTD